MQVRRTEPYAFTQSRSSEGRVETANLDRKRKRSQQDGPARVENEPSDKRARILTDSQTVEDRETAGKIHTEKRHPVNHWVQEGNWPTEYFDRGDQTWEDFRNIQQQKKRLEEIQAQREWDRKQAAIANIMARPLLARKKSSASVRRQELESGGISHSKDSDDKSATYEDSSYAALLEEKGSFMYESDQGITEECRDMCQKLLNTIQKTPHDSLFRDDLFHETCRKLRDRNEARVINDIARLIVPSAETLTTYGATSLKNLVVQMNERWNECIPLTAKLPQPDYSVGFSRSAFTPDQLNKLTPFTGNIFSLPRLSSFVLATWKVYFPFFACEVKCGAGGIDIADRQNAHSMTVAVRGVVELFKYVHREHELHRKILAFSISHDDSYVRIYGHYALIAGSEITFYRHPIHKFDFTDLDGKEKWTAYQFTKNLYEIFMPEHLMLICSAIDDIPSDLDFGVPKASFPSTTSNSDQQQDLAGSADAAGTAPSSPDTTQSKKSRLSVTVMLKQENERQRQQLEREREENKERHAELMDLLKEQKEENKEQKEEIKKLMHLLTQRLG